MKLIFQRLLAAMMLLVLSGQAVAGGVYPDTFGNMRYRFRSVPVSGLKPMMIATRMAHPAVASVANTGTTGGGTATQFQENQRWKPLAPVRYIKVRFANYYGNLAQLGNGPSQLTLRMAVALSAAPIYRGVNVANGSYDLVLQPGQFGDFMVDLGAVVPAGTTIMIYKFGTYASAPSVWPASDVISSAASEYQNFGTALTDRTVGPARWPTDNHIVNFSILPPLAIWTEVATVTLPSVSVVGDSIGAAGDNDGTFADAHGWSQRGLNDASIPWETNGGRGMQLLSLVADSAQMQKRIDALVGTGITHILLALGTNDIGVNQSFAQYKLNIDAFNAYCVARGFKVIPSTFPPRTDAGNTTYNSAGGAGSWTARTQANAYIRSNPYGNGFFDAASFMEDPSNPNLWRTDLGSPTSDGIHPSTVIHTAVAAGLTSAAPTLFVVTQPVSYGLDLPKQPANDNEMERLAA